MTVVKLEDSRLGMSQWEVGKETFNKILADEQDVGAWVANAFATEFARAGYRVRRCNGSLPTNCPVIVRGHVPGCYTWKGEGGMVYAGVRVKLVVERDGVVVLNDEFWGGHVLASGLCYATASETCLRNALQSLTSNAVPTLVWWIETSGK